MGQLSWWHWLVVAVVGFLLFGLRRLPDAARALGRSLRILRAEARGIETDGGTHVVEGSARTAGEPVPDAGPADAGGPAGQPDRSRRRRAAGGPAAGG